MFNQEFPVGELGGLEKVVSSPVPVPQNGSLMLYPNGVILNFSQLDGSKFGDLWSILPRPKRTPKIPKPDYIDLPELALENINFSSIGLDLLNEHDWYDVHNKQAEERLYKNTNLLLDLLNNKDHINNLVGSGQKVRHLSFDLIDDGFELKEDGDFHVVYFTDKKGKVRTEIKPFVAFDYANVQKDIDEIGFLEWSDFVDYTKNPGSDFDESIIAELRKAIKRNSLQGEVVTKKYVDSINDDVLEVMFGMLPAFEEFEDFTETGFEKYISVLKNFGKYDALQVVGKEFAKTRKYDPNSDLLDLILVRGKELGVEEREERNYGSKTTFSDVLTCYKNFICSLPGKAKRGLRRAGQEIRDLYQSYLDNHGGPDPLGGPGDFSGDEELVPDYDNIFDVDLPIPEEGIEDLDEYVPISDEHSESIFDQFSTDIDDMSDDDYEIMTSQDPADEKDLNKPLYLRVLDGVKDYAAVIGTVATVGILSAAAIGGGLFNNSREGQPVDVKPQLIVNVDAPQVSGVDAYSHPEVVQINGYDVTILDNFTRGDLVGEESIEQGVVMIDTALTNWDGNPSNLSEYNLGNSFDYTANLMLKLWAIEEVREALGSNPEIDGLYWNLNIEKVNESYKDKGGPFAEANYQVQFFDLIEPKVIVNVNVPQMPGVDAYSHPDEIDIGGKDITILSAPNQGVLVGEQNKEQGVVMIDTALTNWDGNPVSLASYDEGDNFTTNASFWLKHWAINKTAEALNQDPEIDGIYWQLEIKKNNSDYGEDRGPFAEANYQVQFIDLPSVIDDNVSIDNGVIVENNSVYTILVFDRAEYSEITPGEVPDNISGMYIFRNDSALKDWLLRSEDKLVAMYDRNGRSIEWNGSLDYFLQNNPGSEQLLNLSIEEGAEEAFADILLVSGVLTDAPGVVFDPDTGIYLVHDEENDIVRAYATWKTPEAHYEFTDAENFDNVTSSSIPDMYGKNVLTEQEYLQAKANGVVFEEHRVQIGEIDAFDEDALDRANNSLQYSEWLSNVTEEGNERLAGMFRDRGSDINGGYVDLEVKVSDYDSTKLEAWANCYLETSAKEGTLMHLYFANMNGSKYLFLWLDKDNDTVQGNDIVIYFKDDVVVDGSSMTTEDLYVDIVFNNKYTYGSSLLRSVVNGVEEEFDTSGNSGDADGLYGNDEGITIRAIKCDVLNSN